MVKDKKEHYDRYGWTVDEENLKTLPAYASESAKKLTQWLTLEGRRKLLVEWISHCQEDGRIHGKFWPIGAWTGRMSHSAPNQANIPSFSKDLPKNPVEEIKYRYDADMRGLWGAKDPDVYLVGTDAEGIQLRLLAHYMKSPAYVEAICSGDKKLGTDIHSMNMRALGPICKTRDDAKTFIYAFLLGASIPKVAEILSCSSKQASEAVNNFLTALPELKRLKEVKIPYDASKGFFIGLDGRKVPCDSTHLMLAGYLQNGESVVMKHACIKWRTEAKAAGIKFKQVDFVHDEWQTECHGMLEEAEELGRLQCKAIEWAGKELELFCPLSGETKIGRNWRDTH